jgi:hypothetical protein
MEAQDVHYVPQTHSSASFFSLPIKAFDVEWLLLKRNEFAKIN